MGGPEISVIVPIYRVEPYIRQCLESIAAQTFESFEAICVDDCGDDRSIDIAEEFAAKDKRFIVVRHTHNLGQGGARNTGMAAACGQYITFVDSDDWILPEKYEKEFREIEITGFPSVWSKFSFYYNDEDIRKAHFPCIDGALRGPIDLEANLSYPGVWNRLFRAECLRKSGITFLEHVKHEDSDFFFRFHCLYPQTSMLDESLYIYRQRADSTLGVIQSDGGNCLDLLSVFGNCHDFLKNRGLWPYKKKQYLTLISTLSEYYLNSKHYREKMIYVLQQILAKINYPEEFANNRIPVLDAVEKWRKDGIRRKAAKVLYFLNNMNPISGVRRRWRKTLRMHR